MQVNLEGAICFSRSNLLQNTSSKHCAENKINKHVTVCPSKFIISSQLLPNI